MENEKVVMLKLYNGDFMIGTIDSESKDDSNIYLNDPRDFAIMPTMAGGIQVALRPICSPFKSNRLKKACEVRKDQILFILNEDEIDNEVVNGYKSEISGIKIASAAETASIASNSSSATSPKEFII